MAIRTDFAFYPSSPSSLPPPSRKDLRVGRTDGRGDGLFSRTTELPGGAAERETPLREKMRTTDAGKEGPPIGGRRKEERERASKHVCISVPYLGQEDSAAEIDRKRPVGHTAVRSSVRPSMPYFSTPAKSGDKLLLFLGLSLTLSLTHRQRTIKRSGSGARALVRLLLTIKQERTTQLSLLRTDGPGHRGRRRRRRTAELRRVI